MMSDETPQPDVPARLGDMSPDQLRSLREAYGVEDVTEEQLRRCVDPNYVLLRPTTRTGGMVGRRRGGGTTHGVCFGASGSNWGLVPRSH
jgi:hypothetical protein